jgi:hypothetical protein
MQLLSLLLLLLSSSSLLLLLSDFYNYLFSRFFLSHFVFSAFKFIIWFFLLIYDVIIFLAKLPKKTPNKIVNLHFNAYQKLEITIWCLGLKINVQLID